MPHNGARLHAYESCPLIPVSSTGQALSLKFTLSVAEGKEVSGEIILVISPLGFVSLPQPLNYEIVA